MTAERQRLILKGIVLAIAVGFIFLLSRYGPQPFGVLEPLWNELEEAPSRRARFARYLTSLGPYSSAVFIFLQALQVIASPIPGEITGIVGGYVYGKVFGFVLSTIGLTLGSWIAFEIAHILGRPFVERFVRGKVLAKFDFVTTHTGTMVCFLLFLLPGFPKDYLCYLLGLSRMSLNTFVIVSTIGRMPGTYLLTVQGASLRSQEYVAAVLFALISAAVLLVAYLYREPLFRWLKRRKRVTNP
jgi:uncharacterized membrane protein YdjX (TVP38/TMEM64 family)